MSKYTLQDKEKRQFHVLTRHHDRALACQLTPIFHLIHFNMMSLFFYKKELMLCFWGRNYFYADAKSELGTFGIF